MSMSATITSSVSLSIYIIVVRHEAKNQLQDFVQIESKLSTCKYLEIIFDIFREIEKIYDVKFWAIYLPCQGQ